MKERMVKPSLCAMAYTLSTRALEHIKEKCRQESSDSSFAVLFLDGNGASLTGEGASGSSYLSCGVMAALPKMLPSRMSIFFFAIVSIDYVIISPLSAQDNPWLRWKLGHTRRCFSRFLPTLQGLCSHGFGFSW